MAKFLLINYFYMTLEDIPKKTWVAICVAIVIISCSLTIPSVIETNAAYRYGEISLDERDTEYGEAAGIVFGLVVGIGVGIYFVCRLKK